MNPRKMKLDESIKLNAKYQNKQYIEKTSAKLIQYYSDSNKKTYTRSFIPKSEKYYNKRLDYLMRVLNKKGFAIDRNIAINILNDNSQYSINKFKNIKYLRIV